MTRPIDAYALKYDIGEIDDGQYKRTELYVTNEAIAKQPTIDAVPISFIEEQVKLCKEIGFQRGEECYMALIEKWREKNGTKTD